MEDNTVELNNGRLLFKHEACKTETQSRTLRDKSVATAIKKPQALQHSPTDAQSGVSHLQRVSGAAA
jgi:hypothetical protein